MTAWEALHKAMAHGWPRVRSAQGGADCDAQLALRDPPPLAPDADRAS